MDKIKITDLFDLNKTIAKNLFEAKEYAWEVLPYIKDFIISLGNTLPSEIYDRVQDDVWIAKNAKIFPSAYIAGPCIIDEEAEVRHSAFIRGSAIVGKKAVVGNSTELKNAILFDNVQVPHFNYVGDSVLGYKAHMGAGAVTSNVKSDKTLVKIKGEEIYETNLKKVGAMLGDYVEVGCNTVLCPGSVVGKNTTIYPSNIVRGAIAENSIYKEKNCVCIKRKED